MKPSAALGLFLAGLACATATTFPPVIACLLLAATALLAIHAMRSHSRPDISTPHPDIQPYWSQCVHYYDQPLALPSAQPVPPGPLPVLPARILAHCFRPRRRTYPPGMVPTERWFTHSFCLN